MTYSDIISAVLTLVAVLASIVWLYFMFLLGVGEIVHCYFCNCYVARCNCNRHVLWPKQEDYLLKFVCLRDACQFQKAVLENKEIKTRIKRI